MALNNLLKRGETVLLPNGSPNAGGHIDIFEPNTAVRIATYKDSDLTQQNTNPVILDAAGKASIWFAPNADMDFRTAPTPSIPLGTIYASDPSINPDALGSGSASGLVPNGSFEIDTDANDEPDGWTLTDEAGSTNFLDTINSTDGLQSMRFESTGNGGGNIVTDDFFVVNDIDDLSVQFDLFSSVANVRNIVRIEWYDSSQVTISNTDVYDDSATNPVVFTSQQTVGTPPAGARFAKLRIIGCDPSIATVGSTNFDRFNVFYPLTVSGAFDNLLLAGNTISSTNTDGAINLVPDGAGVLSLGLPASAQAFSTIINAGTGFDAILGFYENAVQQFRLFHDSTANAFKLRAINAGDFFQFEEGNGTNVAAILTPNGTQLRIPGTSGTPLDVQFATSDSGYIIADLDAALKGFMLSAENMNLTSVFTPGLLFGSTDSAFTTTNPKTLGGIFGEATEGFAADTDGGLKLSFYGMGNAPGVTPALVKLGDWDTTQLRAVNTVTGAGLERVLTASDLGGTIQGAIKTADTARNTTITETDDPDLAGFALQPSTMYILEAVLRFEGNGATANGFRWQFDFNGQVANLDVFTGAAWSYQSSGSIESIIATQFDTFQVKSTFDAAGVREKVIIKLCIVTQSDYVADTPVDLQWAQGTSNGTDTSLEGGSYMTVTEVTAP